MAVIRDAGPSASQSATYDAFGNDEDFSPIITNIDPDKTPFLSNLAEDDDAVETKFNWITEGLRPPQMNAHLEKEDYTTGKVGSMRSLDNNVQVFFNSGYVTDMQRKTRKIYKQQDEFDRQKTKAFFEHARDIEYALVNGDTKRDGTASVAALTGGVPYFLKSATVACTLETGGTPAAPTGVFSTGNVKHELETGDFVYFNAATMPAGLVKDTIYYVRLDAAAPEKKFALFHSMKGAIENIVADQVIPTAAGTGVVIEKNNVTDLGGTKDYTVDDINAVMQMCYYRGGNPSKLWMSPKNKKRFSSLVTSLATTNRKSGDKKMNIVADTLETDFGMVTAQPHLWYPNNRIDAMDEEYFALKWFDRTHEVANLAKKGNYSEFVIEGSIGLKGTQPHASGSILNIKY